MGKYLITMTLETDACFGAGESKNGLVNTEVLLDKNSFPYLLSKTFLGVLRENVENFVMPIVHAESSTTDRKLRILKSFFSDIKCKGEEKTLFNINLSNFMIDKTIVNKLSDEKIEEYISDKNSREISTKAKLESFMKIEQATRINSNQVAEKASLRSIRVINKGLVFTSVLEINGDIVDDDIKFIEKCLKTVKHIGIGKTRGMGKVKLELKDIENIETEISKLVMPQNKNFIRYEFELKEPVKVSKSEEQYDFEPTHKHIPGGTMRGAFFAQWLKKDNSKALKYIENINYYNAYPVYIEDDKKYYTIPMPNIYRHDKQKAKYFCEGKDIWEYKFSKALDEKDFVFETIFDSYESNSLYIRSGSQNFMYKFKPMLFCFAKKYNHEDEAIFTYDVDTKQYFHHTNKKENENIYRYEAIKPGYLYYGFLDLSKFENDKDKEEVINLLIKNTDLWVGGSKKTGYGRVQLKAIVGYESSEKAFDDMGITKENLNNEKNADMLYLYSDYAGDLSEIEIAEKDMSLSLNKVTGYNNHWNARTPIREIIEKGSVIRSTKDKIAELKNELENNAVLKEEGLGVVIKNPTVMSLNKIYILKDKKETQSKQYYNSETSTNYKPFFEKFVESYVQRKIKSWITPYIETGEFEKFVLNIKLNLGENFKTSANELINIIDNQKIWKNNLDDSLKSWMNEKQSVSLNREQVENNHKFLDLEIIGNFTLESFINDSLERNEIKFGKGLNINNPEIKPFNAQYKELNQEVEILCDSLGLFEKRIEEYEVQIDLLRHILYYAVFSYENDNKNKGGKTNV